MTERFYYLWEKYILKIEYISCRLTSVQRVKNFEYPIVVQNKEFYTQIFCRVQDYFSGHSQSLVLPLKMDGTEFKKKVFDAVLKIPYGEQRTYQQIAKEIGQADAYRAVGQVLKKNPFLIAVPCHRVRHKDSKKMGYLGGCDLKIALLNWEEQHLKKRVSKTISNCKII